MALTPSNPSIYFNSVASGAGRGSTVVLVVVRVVFSLAAPEPAPLSFGLVNGPSSTRKIFIFTKKKKISHSQMKGNSKNPKPRQNKFVHKVWQMNLSVVRKTPGCTLHEYNNTIQEPFPHAEQSRDTDAEKKNATVKLYSSRSYQRIRFRTKFFILNIIEKTTNGPFFLHFSAIYLAFSAEKNVLL